MERGILQNNMRMHLISYSSNVILFLFSILLLYNYACIQIFVKIKTDKALHNFRSYSANISSTNFPRISCFYLVK